MYSYATDMNTMPSIKLDRLAIELEQIEAELKELEKDDIPSGYGPENDAQNHIKEIRYLREEMKTILDSDIFKNM